MIKARHTLTGNLVSRYYSGQKLNRVFSAIHYHGEPDSSGLPVLLLGNHFSWWDGFIQYRLNKHIFGKKLYVMMLEEQLKKNMILNRCGCFSVRKNSREIIESLNYCAEIMENRDNMLLIFPQGEIQSMHSEEICFESGLNYLMKHIRTPYNIAFNVNLVDYHSEKRPILDVYWTVFAEDSFRDFKEAEVTFNKFYRRCKQRQCKIK